MDNDSLPPRLFSLVDPEAVARMREAAAKYDRPEMVAARAEAERRDRLMRLRMSANDGDIPDDEDLRRVVLDDDAPVTDALRFYRDAMTWRAGRRRGCVVVAGGPRGVGKTAGACHAAVRAQTSAGYVSAVDVGATPRNGWSTNEEAWQRWLTRRVLVLDDLGTESAAPEVLVTLLWQRYDHGDTTLVTTNLNAGELAARYFGGEIGARLADRLVYAQRRTDDAGNVGPGGLAWYEHIAGTSLRSVAARKALIAAAVAK